MSHLIITSIATTNKLLLLVKKTEDFEIVFIQL